MGHLWVVCPVNNYVCGDFSPRTLSTWGGGGEFSMTDVEADQINLIATHNIGWGGGIQGKSKSLPLPFDVHRISSFTI